MCHHPGHRLTVTTSKTNSYTYVNRVSTPRLSWASDGPWSSPRRHVGTTAPIGHMARRRPAPTTSNPRPHRRDQRRPAAPGVPGPKQPSTPANPLPTGRHRALVPYRRRTLGKHAVRRSEPRTGPSPTRITSGPASSAQQATQPVFPAHDLREAPPPSAPTRPSSPRDNEQPPHRPAFALTRLPRPAGPAPRPHGPVHAPRPPRH
jgi:hypothetical protein